MDQDEGAILFLLPTNGNEKNIVLESKKALCTVILGRNIQET